jgi:hypothetical protein
MPLPSLVKIHPDTDHCLLLVPADEESQEFCKRVLRQVIATIGLVPMIRDASVWSKEEVESGSKTNSKQEVDAHWDDIVETKVIAADVTGRDPEVSFALGLALAVGKNVTYVTRNTEDVPFGGDYVLYSLQNRSTWRTLQIALSDMIEEILGS